MSDPPALPSNTQDFKTTRSASSITRRSSAGAPAESNTSRTHSLSSRPDKTDTPTTTSTKTINTARATKPPYERSPDRNRLTSFLRGLAPTPGERLKTPSGALLSLNRRRTTGSPTLSLDENDPSLGSSARALHPRHGTGTNPVCSVNSSLSESRHDFNAASYLVASSRLLKGGSVIQARSAFPPAVLSTSSA